MAVVLEHKVHEGYTKYTTLCSSWFVVFVVLPVAALREFFEALRGIQKNT